MNSQYQHAYCQVSGTPFEQGVQQGQELSDAIRRNLASVHRKLEQEKVDLQAYQAFVNQNLRFFQEQRPEMYEELQGIAQGSGLPLDDILLLNIPAYFLCESFRHITQECSMLCVRGQAAADGCTYIIKNRDMGMPMEQALVRHIYPDGQEIIEVGGAGILTYPAVGINSHGLAVTTTGFWTEKDPTRIDRVEEADIFLNVRVLLSSCRTAAQAVEFCRTAAAELDAHFAQYELVVVDDACTDDTVAQLRAWGKEQAAPLTILHMSTYHGLENAMNAGLDAAIGDYVYEFDSTELCYPAELIFKAYPTALTGGDIVSVCPRTVRGSSGLFYKVFNAHSQSAYRLRTDAFRLVTRRAINRVHASSAHLPYRKAAYAASGLKMTDLEFDGQLTVKSKGRFNLALDSLALYTNAGFKASMTVTLCMLALALAELVYTLVVFITGHPVEGWTTTMFVITVGFSGLFAVLTIVVKYLSLLVDLVFKQQKYLVESIEKLQK